MREDFIHYLWKYKILLGTQLTTTDGRRLLIKSVGIHNHHSGPDFFNGRIVIDEQEWAGNIEMHVKSSDWFLHNHDSDPAYDNVILHVVWNHDLDVPAPDGNPIPVLEVRELVPVELMHSYQNLFAIRSDQFINCENNVQEVDRFKRNLWLEKVFFERLEIKTARIARSLKASNNDWEAAFFHVLARSFGGKINADAMEETARSMDQATVRKLARDAFSLEAVLLGQAGLLDVNKQDHYYKQCEGEYAFAKAKYQLRPSHTAMRFFKIRPAGYPTIRISQLSRLYHRSPLLFGEILLAKTKEDYYRLFAVKAAKYWDDHHVFDKQVAPAEKQLTEPAIDLLIINCVVPFKFYYGKCMDIDYTEQLLQLMRSLKAEKNTTVAGFKRLFAIDSAMESQSVLQLKPAYCDVNRCLHCDIGVALLRS